MLGTACHAAGTSDPAEQRERSEEKRVEEKGRGRPRKKRPEAHKACIQPTAPLATDDNAFVSGEKRVSSVSLFFFSLVIDSHRERPLLHHCPLDPILPPF